MIRLRPGFLTLVAAIGVSAPLFGIQLDPTFGDRGIALGPFDVGVSGMALQADGALVTVGGDGSGGVALVRFTRNGAIDSTFGSAGLATSFPSSNVQPAGLAIQPDGKIVLAGTVYASPTASIFVARYLSNGSLDPDFGTGGSVTTGLTPEGDSASSLVLQPDGRIVVAGAGGTQFQLVAQNFEVVRYNTDGSLDPSFGIGGSVIVNMGGPGISVVLRPDGRLVVGGWIGSPTGQDSFALLGLLGSGAIDPQFGTGGQVFTQVDTSDYGNAIALSPDGKIVSTGATASAVVVLRYRADGSLDPAFASGGIFKFDLRSAPNAIAVDRQNRVVVTGAFNAGFGLLRLLPNGREDPSIGPQGWTSVLGGAPPQFQAYPGGLAIQANGEIVIGGVNVEVIAGYVTLVRYADATVAVPTLSVGVAFLIAAVLGLAGCLAIQRVA